MYSSFPFLARFLIWVRAPFIYLGQRSGPNPVKPLSWFDRALRFMRGITLWLAVVAWGVPLV
jgi:hypothetical protein